MHALLQQAYQTACRSTTGRQLRCPTDNSRDFLPTTDAQPGAGLGGHLPGLGVAADGSVAKEFGLEPSSMSEVVLADFHELALESQYALRAEVLRLAPGAELADGTRHTEYDRMRTQAGVGFSPAGRCSHCAGRWVPILSAVLALVLAFLTASVGGRALDVSFGELWYLPGIAGIVAGALLLVCLPQGARAGPLRRAPGRRPADRTRLMYHPAYCLLSCLRRLDAEVGRT